MNELLTIGLAIVFVGVSALCSGLNVAIVALSIEDVERKAKVGNKDAKRVLQLKRNSHLTLASILFTNVGAVTATSLTLDTVFGGLIAGVVSTFVLVIFGEILPQAILSKKALKTCSRFSPMMRLMIFVTYPVSKPVQLFLDKVFTSHSSSELHTRDELGLIISEHIKDSRSELDESEVEIIQGALLLSEKRVRDIMTPIKSVYWLNHTDIIDAKRIDEIKAENYSRIPILNKDHTLCEGLLLMKDLVDIDFDSRSYRVDELTLRSTRLVGAMTALDTLFRKFINARTHLMPVERDDKIVGIVTIEDLIEEIIGHEIEDETDEKS